MKRSISVYYISGLKVVDEFDESTMSMLVLMLGIHVMDKLKLTCKVLEAFGVIDEHGDTKSLLLAMN